MTRISPAWTSKLTSRTAATRPAEANCSSLGSCRCLFRKPEPPLPNKCQRFLHEIFIDLLIANLSYKCAKAQSLSDRISGVATSTDRKSTRLNSSTNAHLVCRLLLEKKKKQTYIINNKRVLK